MSKPSSFVILQISDLHILADPDKTLSDVNTEESFKKTLKQAFIQHKDIDLIIVSGDLAQDPCQSSYQRIFKILKKYKTRTICLPGNHDDFTLMQKTINGELVNCQKHIKTNNWQIISLNSKKEGSQAGFLKQQELELLTDKIKQNPNLNTLIAVHHHPVSIESPWMDGMMIENNADLFLTIKNKPQVKAIICGHIHQVFEATQMNIKIFSAPSTCFQFKPNALQFAIDKKRNAGYRLIRLHSNGEIQSSVY